MASEANWFVYIARCNDGSLYTGIARDVLLRIAAHNAGRGARYTRGRGPLSLCAQRRCTSKGDALRLEWAVKQLPRPEKETLLGVRRLAVFARRLAANAAQARSSCLSRRIAQKVRHFREAGIQETAHVTRDALFIQRERHAA